jgi:hypothetical protein
MGAPEVKHGYQVLASDEKKIDNIFLSRKKSYF